MEKSGQKRINEIGWLFLISLIIHVLASFGMSFLTNKGIGVGIELQLVISELTIVVPALIYVLRNKLSYRNDLGFRKIKVGTIFMSVLLAALVMPLMSFVNLLTQLFVPNTMVQMSSEITSGSGILVLLLSSLYGPICEEFFFRSVMFNGYSKISGITKAVFASALLFGLLHLNVNQACYAIVLGIAVCIINTASGSVYTSMIIHIVINGANMLLLLFVNMATKMAGSSDVAIEQAAEDIRKGSLIYVMIAIYFVLAIAGVAISIPCIGWMAKHEGQSDKLMGIFRRCKECTDEKKKTRIIFNVPTIIAIVLTLFIMFGLDALLNAFGYSIK